MLAFSATTVFHKQSPLQEEDTKRYWRSIHRRQYTTRISHLKSG